ncbi:hypothetical protein [Poseidonocella sp. HB161398]|uniref:hypothetical protein n=1 Tax=Poseidonocella sp. HB161398 TaxID=2320855 RepID=UPI001109AF12|nr:hypothetical protein [Poseidonocella sp. HB161398]
MSLILSQGSTGAPVWHARNWARDTRDPELGVGVTLSHFLQLQNTLQAIDTISLSRKAMSKAQDLRDTGANFPSLTMPKKRQREL